MINHRLLDDTSVFVEKSFSDVIKGNYEKGNKTLGSGKPIMLINGTYFIIENYTEPKKIIKLTQLLTPKNVSVIDVLKTTGGGATALFGDIGANGAILITLSNKKVARKINKLKI